MPGRGPKSAALFDAESLLYYWPYARFGINFHPPLAGQLNLATHALFDSWMKDIPCTADGIGHRVCVDHRDRLRLPGSPVWNRAWTGHVWLAVVHAAALRPGPSDRYRHPRALPVDGRRPGVLEWIARRRDGWRWRVLVGVLLGLAFVEKMAAVGVLLPLLLWLVVAHLPRSLAGPGAAGQLDRRAVHFSGLMLLPLLLSFQEIQGLQRQLPPPKQTNLFVHKPSSDLSGAILAVPLVIWLLRRLLGRVFRGSKVWGVERPALETWTAILAFVPVVGWLGNPAWWRETLPRLAHYYTLSNDRQGSLPDIQIIYFGQTYEYTLPWHNAWVLLGITVPMTILLASAIGIIWGLGQVRSDRLPLYFLLQFLTLPVLRMLPKTPAHDGVRLFLPTFYFLAAFAGWGTVALARALSRRARLPAQVAISLLAALVLAPAAVELAHIHPFELSYYNLLIGGPRGAWQRGFELTYWCDAFNGRTLDDLNQSLPAAAELDFPNELTNPMTLQELQTLGALRSDIELGGDVQFHSRKYDRLGYVWMQTQDSKATAFSRLLFAMRPGTHASPGSSTACAWRPWPTLWRSPGRGHSSSCSMHQIRNRRKHPRSIA